MIEFLKRILVFGIVLLVSFYSVFLLENGTSDPFYQRFTTPKQEALVIGNSKSAQGIIPSIINEKLKGLYDGQLYNYSFTVYNSPYGPAYLESIKSKLASFKGKRCFIITVDPWSISSDINDPNNLENFEENERFIEDIESVNSRPNIPYLIKWFSKSYYEILFARLKDNFSIVHEDGWFESTGDMIGTTENQRRELMKVFYSNYLRKYSVSKSRIAFFIETIKYLKVKGDVYLVRMPLHTDILQIEDHVDPNFHKRISSISEYYEIPFFDFTQTLYSFDFKDGLHLNKKSAKDFSLLLSQMITKVKLSNS